jgi:hypothetical protein
MDINSCCRNITIDACNQLKAAYNNDSSDNLRIYIIKYRCQQSYKDKITESNNNFDYSYLDECATDTSHIYAAETPAELEAHLQNIATSIRTWAGRTPAMVVEH